MELDANCGHAVERGLMAQTKYVLTLERVAEILDEDLELIETIIANDDNLSCGSIVYVDMAAGNDTIKALTVDGVEELRQMLADARSSQQEWDIFLTDFVADPEIIARVKPKQPRWQPGGYHRSPSVAGTNAKRHSQWSQAERHQTLSTCERNSGCVLAAHGFD